MFPLSIVEGAVVANSSSFTLSWCANSIGAFVVKKEEECFIIYLPTSLQFSDQGFNLCDKWCFSVARANRAIVEVN